MSDKAEKVKQPKKEKKPAEPPDMLQPRQLIAAHSGKQYLIEHILGKGGFGEVYQVSLYKHPERKFAMKVEQNALDGKPNSMLRLKVEIYVFEQMAQCKTFDHTHFVKMHDKGITAKFKYYVMDVIWGSLKEICQKTLGNKPLSPHTVMHIARQTLKSIRQLHELGFLHRDIKWHNFAVGLPPKDTTIFMLDFGIARPYREKNGNVRIAREKVPFLGTIKYASVRSLNNEDQGRRDDLESWLYMMLELYDPVNLMFFMQHKTLPEIRQHKEILMENPKKLHDVSLLKMPAVYVKIIDHIEKLKYADEPKYAMIDGFLGLHVDVYKLNMDLPLDWKGKWEVEEKKRKEEEAKKKEEKRDESRKDELEPLGGDDRKESRKKDKKKERRRESKKKRKKQSRNNDDETLITMEEMLDELKEEKKRRLKQKKAGRTMEDDEDDYWKSDEDSEDDISGDEDDYRRKRKKKKSRKRRSKERTRDYSDRDNDDYETCPPNDRDYDKTPIRRRRQKRTSGGRKKSASKMSKVSRKYDDDQDKKNASKMSKVGKKTYEEDQEKSVVGIPEKVSKLTNPEPDDGAYMMLGAANAMEKAQDTKDKDKKDMVKKDGDKKEEKCAPPSGSAEPVKKASEAAPDKKEPADAKKK